MKATAHAPLTFLFQPPGGNSCELTVVWFLSVVYPLSLNNMLILLPLDLPTFDVTHLLSAIIYSVSTYLNQSPLPLPPTFRYGLNTTFRLLTGHLCTLKDIPGPSYLDFPLYRMTLLLPQLFRIILFCTLLSFSTLFFVL